MEMKHLSFLKSYKMMKFHIQCLMDALTVTFDTSFIIKIMFVCF